jgi:hypothetical protein
MGDTQAADQHTDSTDTPPATTGGSDEDDTTETAVEIARKFGTTDTDAHDNVQECVVGSDDIVLWAPADEEEPAGIPISGFDSEARFTSQYANVGDTVRAVYGMIADDTVHVFQADPIHNLADALGITPAALMDVARINTDRGSWPVLFDLTESERHEGHVLVADIAPGESDSEGTENTEASQ